MTPRQSVGPPLAVVGPTATGKSALALEIARQLFARGVAAEIISVDSMQVYRRMDIGTAKLSKAERGDVAHWMIDMVEPSESMSVARFAREADAVRRQLDDRGVVPLYVGGTGLYHRVVLDRMEVPGEFSDVRARLEADAETEHGVVELYERLAELDPVGVRRIEPGNRRRIVRALEVTLGTGRPFSSFGPGLTEYCPSEVVFVGLEIGRDVLTRRLSERFDRQVADGFVEEVEALLAERTWSRTARQALGYAQLAGHLEGRLTFSEARESALAATRRFSIRQIRWFRRDPRIEWLDATRPIADLAGHAIEVWSARGET